MDIGSGNHSPQIVPKSLSAGSGTVAREFRPAAPGRCPPSPPVRPLRIPVAILGMILGLVWNARIRVRDGRILAGDLRIRVRDTRVLVRNLPIHVRDVMTPSAKPRILVRDRPIPAAPRTIPAAPNRTPLAPRLGEAGPAHRETVPKSFSVDRPPVPAGPDRVPVARAAVRSPPPKRFATLKKKPAAALRRRKWRLAPLSSRQTAAGPAPVRWTFRRTGDPADSYIRKGPRPSPLKPRPPAASAARWSSSGSAGNNRP